MKLEIGTQLEETVLTELKVLASEQNRPINEIIQDALTDYLRRGKQASQGKAGLARMLAREPLKVSDEQFREAVELDYFDQ